MSRWLTQFRLALRSVFLRKRVDQELDEELQDHLERQIKEGLNLGLTLEEAPTQLRGRWEQLPKARRNAAICDM